MTACVMRACPVLVRAPQIFISSSASRQEPPSPSAVDSLSSSRGLHPRLTFADVVATITTHHYWPLLVATTAVAAAATAAVRARARARGGDMTLLPRRRATRPYPGETPFSRRVFDDYKSGA